MHPISHWTDTLKRANGRTYRKALAACLAASRGNKVLFLYGNDAERRSIVSEIKNHAPAGTILGCKSKFEFPGGGVVDIRHIANNFAGQRMDYYIYDELSGVSTGRAIDAFVGIQHACPKGKLD